MKMSVANLFVAVCKKETEVLRRMYSTDGDAFVYDAYWLYRNGLIRTSWNNFIEGGDGLIPIDIISPTAFEPTEKGRCVWMTRKWS